MLTNQVVTDSFGRIEEIVGRAVTGLSEDDLTFQPAKQANTIAWLVWHLTRIQDDHIADVADREQVWSSEGWVQRFKLPFDESATGYGQQPKDVRAVRLSAEQLLGYHRAVHDQTVAFINTLTEKDYGRIVDRQWDPPVTLAMRLVSVIADDLQHAGQAAYIRGLLP